MSLHESAEGGYWRDYCNIDVKVLSVRRNLLFVDSWYNDVRHKEEIMERLESRILNLNEYYTVEDEFEQIKDPKEREIRLLLLEKIHLENVYY